MKKTDGCLDEVSKCVGAFSVFRIRTPAGLNGHADTVRVLVAELGADVNVRNSIGNTPMHFAALEGQSELIRVFEMLGTDVGEEDSYEITPLHYSAANGHANTARVLVVELGACADVRNSKGGCECEKHRLQHPRSLGRTEGSQGSHPRLAGF